MIKEIFGKKIGMTHLFGAGGDLISTSVIEVEPVCILEKINYPTKSVVKIGCFKINDNRVDKVKKPVKGYFDKLKIHPYKLIKEVYFNGEVEVKKEVGVEIFNEGELVDVRGKSKGRGFAGGMKRHGWHGQPKSHGAMSHRRIGSAGSNTYPGRILKGHRMPGHMGDVYRTIRNLKIAKVDREKNLIFVEGGVPGSRGSIINIKKV